MMNDKKDDYDDDNDNDDVDVNIIPHWQLCYSMFKYTQM